MQFLRGTPTWSQLRRSMVAGHNVGAIVLGAGETTIVSLDMGTVVPGDLIFMNGYFLGTPQAGVTRLNILLRGIAGASPIFTENVGQYDLWIDNPAVLVAQKHGLSAWFFVIGSGPTTLTLRGFSTGGNTNIIDGGCEMRALVLRGS